MSLAQIDAAGIEAGTAAITFPSLDRIWTDLDKENREILYRWMYARKPNGSYERTSERVAHDLTSAGYKISPSSIAAARRNEWGPPSNA